MATDITDYRDIFLNDRPMMDTRAPVEFTKGAFPGVVNLPLMTDDERQRVGTCYKQQGQQAAIVLGHELRFVPEQSRPGASSNGRGSPRPIQTVICTAFVAGCARRSCSNG